MLAGLCHLPLCRSGLTESASPVSPSLRHRKQLSLHAQGAKLDDLANPTLRFLLIGLGFLLVNLWQELRWRFCQVIQQRHRHLDADRFKLQRLASFLSRAIEAIYGVISFIETDVQPPSVKSVIY